MRKLAPSILSADFCILKEQIDILRDCGIDFLHFDIMDGDFVPNISFGPCVLKSVSARYDDIYKDAHMMVTEPSRYIKAVHDAGADGITVHAEACSDLAGTLKEIRNLGCDAGVSINPETPLDVINDVLGEVDLVLIMSVHPGFGGQKYIEECTEKIKKLAEIKKESNYKFTIQVDGGINIKTIETALKAGAENIVAGSAVFSNNIKDNTEILKNMVEAYND